MNSNIHQRFRVCLSENSIIVPSYSHYGGINRLQDYGIVGLEIVKNKLIKRWRECFILNGDICEIENTYNHTS